MENYGNQSCHTWMSSAPNSVHQLLMSPIKTWMCRFWSTVPPGWGVEGGFRGRALAQPDPAPPKLRWLPGEPKGQRRSWCEAGTCVQTPGGVRSQVPVQAHLQLWYSLLHLPKNKGKKNKTGEKGRKTKKALCWLP